MRRTARTRPCAGPSCSTSASNTCFPRRQLPCLRRGGATPLRTRCRIPHTGRHRISFSLRIIMHACIARIDFCCAHSRSTWSLPTPRFAISWFCPYPDMTGSKSARTSTCTAFFTRSPLTLVLARARAYAHVCRKLQVSDASSNTDSRFVFGLDCVRREILARSCTRTRILTLRVYAHMNTHTGLVPHQTLTPFVLCWTCRPARNTRWKSTHCA
jgi:hypothetical protein